MLLRLVLLLTVLCFGCTRAQHSEAARRRPTAPPVAPASHEPALYSADEALRDVLSSPLVHLGTGKWPGIRRMYACAYRNDRVLVVDAYCGRTGRQAFRIDVYSPIRGRVRIYAESPGSLATKRRSDYFSFMAEWEPPTTYVRLTMTFAELRAYEDQRYEAFLPVCFAGTELSKPRQGCLGSLAARGAEWSSENRAFLDGASDDWYRAVDRLRTLASQYGREPE